MKILLISVWLLSPWNSPGMNTGVGKPFTSPGYLPDPGIEPGSPALQTDSLPSEPPGESNMLQAVDGSD